MGNDKRIDEAREEFEQQREGETGDTGRDSSSKKAEAEHTARDDYKADGEPFGSLEKRDH